MKVVGLILAMVSVRAHIFSGLFGGKKDEHTESDKNVIGFLGRGEETATQSGLGGKSNQADFWGSKEMTQDECKFGFGGKKENEADFWGKEKDNSKLSSDDTAYKSNPSPTTSTNEPCEECEECSSSS